MPSVLRQVQRLASTSNVHARVVHAFDGDAARGVRRRADRPQRVRAVRVGAAVPPPAPRPGGLERTAASTRRPAVRRRRPSALTPGGDAATELTASIRLATFVYTGAALPVTDTTTTLTPRRRPDERDREQASRRRRRLRERRQKIILGVLGARPRAPARVAGAEAARRLRVVVRGGPGRLVGGRFGGCSDDRRHGAGRRGTEGPGRQARSALDQASARARSVRSADRAGGIRDARGAAPRGSRRARGRSHRGGDLDERAPARGRGQAAVQDGRHDVPARLRDPGQRQDRPRARQPRGRRRVTLSRATPRTIKSSKNGVQYRINFTLPLAAVPSS